MLQRMLIAACLAFAVPAQAADIVLRAGHTNAVGEPQDEGLKILKAKLEAATGGKATIEIYANGVLGNELQLIEGRHTVQHIGTHVCQQCLTRQLRMRGEEPLALRQGHRMRFYNARIFQCRARAAQQTMRDGDDNFGFDEQRSFP